jgi:hypothetical protein
MAPMPQDWVMVGPGAQVQLCHRVFLAPGLGQVWHVYDDSDTYVVSRIDVTGAMCWSVVEDIAAFAAHFNLDVEELCL